MNKRFIFSYFILSLETRQFFREKYGYYRKKQLLRLFNRSQSPLSYYVAGLRLELHINRILINASLVPSYCAARQLLAHGHVLINNNIIRSTTYNVRLGDVISLNTFAGRFLTNMYWIQAIEKFFLSSSHLRYFRIKNLSDKGAAMIPLYNRGGVKPDSKLDKWRTIFSNNHRYWRSRFAYGTVKYKNSSSSFIDSISKRYDDWSYKEHRWFPPFIKKEEEKKKALKRRALMKSLSPNQLVAFVAKRKAEIIAKRKKRNRMLWSLNLAKQNKMKDGSWTRPSKKGLQVLLKNTHSILYLNKKLIPRGRLKQANLAPDVVGKLVREPLKLNLSVHDKRYKKLSSSTRRNCKTILRRFRSNWTKDGFTSFLFSGNYSSRWLSLSKLAINTISKVGLVRYHRKFKLPPIFKRTKKKISIKKGLSKNVKSFQKRLHNFTRKYYIQRGAEKSYSIFKSVRYRRQGSYKFKGKFLNKLKNKTKKSSHLVVKVKGKAKSVRSKKKKKRFPSKKIKICQTVFQSKTKGQLFLDKRKVFYPRVYKPYKGTRLTKSFSSFLKGNQRVGLLNQKLLGKTDLRRIQLLKSLLNQIKSPNDYRLHKFFVFYKSKILVDLVNICNLLLRLQQQKKSVHIAYKKLGMIGLTLSHPMITSFFNTYKSFQKLQSRLSYNRDKSILTRSILLNTSIGKRFLKKSLVKGINCYSQASLERVKSASFFYEWKYHRTIRVKHLYNWRAKVNKLSYTNTFRYKKTDLHTVMYKVKHAAFIALLKRSYYRPITIFGKGHPLKSLALLSPAKKGKGIKKRLFSKKRLYDKGFIGWKGRFRYWYRKRSRNKLLYKGSVSNKYSFNKLYKKKYFTLYSKPVGRLNTRFFSNLYFLGRLSQVQNDLLFRLPPKFLEVDPKYLSITIIRYPYPTELFKDIPIKVPRDVLGMFFKPKH